MSLTHRYRQALHHGWHARCVEPAADAPAGITHLTIPVTVPGHLHTDLLRAGVISDPTVGDGEAAQAWVGRSRWEYICTFDWAPTGMDRVDLVAEGLDTFASVRLNDELLGHTRDQHVVYRWDAAGALRPGANTLRVRFDSVFAVADQAERQIGPLPRPYPDPYPYVRKMACNFGWDWGPRLASVGPWRPIAVESWSRVRIEAVRPQVLVSAAGPSVDLEVHVDLSLAAPVHPPEVRVTVQVLDPDGVCVALAASRPATIPSEARATSAVLALRIPDPRLWWPTGLGAQPLYGVDTSIIVGETVVDTDRRRVGLRSVHIDQEPNGTGTRFALIVNGRRVRVRGYNWIPDLPFPNEVTQDRLDERLDQAVAGGANLLRVWGGGHFASEEFLGGCDERGLLVWHDFLFACAAYSEDADTVTDVRAEAEQAVARMSSHPSLVLWCGGNECVWGWHDWGWRSRLAGRPWGARYFTEILPEVVRRLDPTRPYLPNSPWSGSLGRHPQDQESGVVHIWTVWNELDWTHYRDWNPRFVAEMGWCSPANHATLRRAIPEGDLGPDNPAVIHHMRAHNGMAKLARGLAAHLGRPTDADTWLYLAQLIQARAMTAGVEWLRSRDRCTGVILWQLNDCWPALSWSAIDVGGLRKPVWYAVRRGFADRLLTLQPAQLGDRWGHRGVAVHAVNDTLTPWDLEVTVRRLQIDGHELARETLRLSVPPDASLRVRLAPKTARPRDRAGELLVADAPGHRSLWFFRPDRALRLTRPRLDHAVTIQDGDVLVHLTARSLVRDIALFPDRAASALGVEARGVMVDDMLLTLLPGETATLRLTGLPTTDLDRLRALLTAPPVLRCVGDDRWCS